MHARKKSALHGAPAGRYRLRPIAVLVMWFDHDEMRLPLRSITLARAGDPGGRCPDLDSRHLRRHQIVQTDSGGFGPAE